MTENTGAVRSVLMTADAVGGVWTYALELARALTRTGIELTLVTMGRKLSRRERVEARLVGSFDLIETSFALEWMEEPWRDVQHAGELLLELEQRLRPSCIHLNGFVHGALPFHAPKLVVGHSCVSSWWRAVRGTEPPPCWDRYREAVTRGLRAADLVVAPSSSMLQSLQSDYGPFRHARVIPNGRTFPPAAPFRGKRDYVLAAGRLWDEAKNIAALARVSGRLHRPVCLAGERRGPDGHDLELGHAYWLGRLSPPELSYHMACAKVFAAPARYEPFGLSVLEAAAAGCALVLGDIPSLRENWANAASFVDPDDDDALADALRGLFDDAPQCAAAGLRARTRACELGAETMTRHYQNAYAELVARADAKAARVDACA